jgi:hypothetical protein
MRAGSLTMLGIIAYEKVNLTPLNFCPVVLVRFLFLELGPVRLPRNEDLKQFMAGTII